jgi:hypothetical protein
MINIFFVKLLVCWLMINLFYSYNAIASSAQVASHNMAMSRIDSTLQPLNKQTLATLIKATPLDSESHVLIIAQARANHLEEAAYKEYSELYNAHPKGFYENLWLGAISYKYFEVVGDPTLGKLYAPVDSNALIHVSRRCLRYAIALKPLSSLAYAYYGDFEFWFGIDSPTESHISIGYTALRKAVQLDGNCALAHEYLGDALNCDYCPEYNPILAQAQLSRASKILPDLSYWTNALLTVAIQNQDKKTAKIAFRDLNKFSNLSNTVRAFIPKYSQKIGRLPDMLPPAHVYKSLFPTINTYAVTQKPVTIKKPADSQPVAAVRVKKVSLYVLYHDRTSLSSFRIGADGSLSTFTNPIVCPLKSIGAALDEQGKSLCLFSDTGILSCLQVDIGELTESDSSQIDMLGQPVGVSIGSISHHIYVLINGGIDVYGKNSHTLEKEATIISNSAVSINNFTLNKDEALLFAANSDAGVLMTYKLNGIGKADLVTTINIPFSQHPVKLIVSPNGKNLYAISESGSLIQYSISNDGKLALLKPSLDTIPCGYTSIFFDPDHNHAYGLSYRGSTIQPLKIDEDGGLHEMPFALMYTRPISARSTSPDTFPVQCVVDPYRQYLYILNGDGVLSQYAIMTDGTLRFLNPATLTLTSRMPEDCILLTSD